MNSMNQGFQRSAYALLSMDIVSPLLSVFFDAESDLRELQSNLRSQLRNATKNANEYNFEMFSAIGPISFNDFIKNWYWRPERPLSPAINEAVGIFYGYGQHRKTKNAYFEDTLGIVNLDKSLSEFRSLELDRAVSDAIERCELSLYSKEISDWDAELINKVGIYLDPKIDITFPLYKAYIDYSTIRSGAAFMRRHFALENSFGHWVKAYESMFGKLSYKTRWKEIGLYERPFE